MIYFGEKKNRKHNSLKMARIFFLELKTIENLEKNLGDFCRNFKNFNETFGEVLCTTYVYHNLNNICEKSFE